MQKLSKNDEINAQSGLKMMNFTFKKVKNIKTYSSLKMLKLMTKIA